MDRRGGVSAVQVHHRPRLLREGAHGQQPHPRLERPGPNHRVAGRRQAAHRRHRRARGTQPPQLHEPALHLRRSKSHNLQLPRGVPDREPLWRRDAAAALRLALWLRSHRARGHASPDLRYSADHRATAPPVEPRRRARLFPQYRRRRGPRHGDRGRQSPRRSQPHAAAPRRCYGHDSESLRRPPLLRIRVVQGPHQNDQRNLPPQRRRRFRPVPPLVRPPSRRRARRGLHAKSPPPLARRDPRGRSEHPDRQCHNGRERAESTHAPQLHHRRRLYHLLRCRPHVARRALRLQRPHLHEHLCLPRAGEHANGEGHHELHVRRAEFLSERPPRHHGRCAPRHHQVQERARGARYRSQ